MPRIHCIPVFALLLGCAGFPDLDDTVSDQARRSGYPVLEPVDDLLTRDEDPAAAETVAAVEALRNRARLLDARAAILRRTAVIDSQAQARMKAAYERLTRL